MLLLLIILLTLLVLLFICSSSLLLYYLNMERLHHVTVLSLSVEKCTSTETVRWTRHLSFSFPPRGMCSLLSQKQACLFSWWTPATPAPHPPKEGTLYRWERSSIFATEVTVLFVQRGFEIFQTFQKPDSQVSYLPAHLQWYVFDFEIELKILTFKWMSSIPTGKTYLHCSKSKNDS